MFNAEQIHNVSIHVNEGGIINNEFNQSTSNTPPRPTDQVPARVWLDVPSLISSFCGRKEFIEILHSRLQSRNFMEISSHLTVISGMAGIGKTQTALKYISMYADFYGNVIWIQAETETTLRDSFLRLAKLVKTATTDSSNKSLEFRIIVKNIYQQFAVNEKPTLLVFDNADDLEGAMNEILPVTVEPGLRKLTMLMTSRNKDWSWNHEKCPVLFLETFSEEETLNFILEQLKIPDSAEIREETREFIHLIGGLPLALQQSIAFIRERKAETGQRYNFSDYINEFKSATLNILNYNKVPGSSATVFVTSNVTFKKIKNLTNGQQTMTILIVVAFLYADKVLVSLIQAIFPQFEERIFFSCLSLLEKYCLIKQEFTGNDDNFISIHRQLQIVIMQNLNTSVAEGIFNHVLHQSQIFLKTINYAKSADIFINIHQLLLHASNIIPTTDNFINFIHNFSLDLCNAGRYDESLYFITKTCILRQQILGENHELTLLAQQLKAVTLFRLGNYEDALDLLRDLLKRMGAHLGPQHKETLQTKNTLASVFYEQKKYEEAAHLFEQVLAQKKEVLGKNHRFTLSTHSNLALVFFQQGKWSTALKLYEEIEKRKVETLGVNHPSTLTATHNKALVLLNLGSFQEALDLFHEGYEEVKLNLGEAHPEAIKRLGSIASAEYKKGKWTTALKLWEEVEKKRTDILGVDQPQTLLATERKADVLLQLGRVKEASDLFHYVHNKRTEILGENHPDTTAIHGLIATVEFKEGKFSTALELYEEVERKQIEFLGSEHPRTLIITCNKAMALLKLGRVKEASDLFQYVYEKMKGMLGENHPDTISTLGRIADVEDKEGKRSVALKRYKEVEKKQVEILGADHPHTLDTTNRKAKVLFRMGSVQEASELFRLVYEDRKRILSEDHPDTISTHSWISRVVEKEGRLPEALNLKREVLERRKKVLGLDHPKTKETEREVERLLQPRRCQIM